MSISMNNHESRIKALENKIGSGGGIVESSLSDNGFVKFNNGLIINWGNSGIYSARQIKTLSMVKAFTNTNYIVIAYNMLTTRDNFFSYQPHNLATDSFKLRCQDSAGSSGGTVKWIAIGY